MSGHQDIVCQYYKVVYTDDVEREIIFSDQITEDLRAGDKTPEFEGTPEREGYTFMGWRPTVSSVVSAEDAIDGVITYKATWQKN